MRRALLQSLLAMAGDGLRRPVNAPPESVIPVGVQPGAQSPVVTANRIIVSGAKGGVFVYNGVPALGNPPIAWTTGATTDPFGNAIPASGTGTTAPGLGWSDLQQGNLYLGAIGDPLARAAVLSAAAAGELQLTGNVQAGADVPALVFLLSKLFTATPLPQVQVGSSVQNCAFQVFGPVISTLGTPANPSLITTDVENSLGALAAGSGYTVNNGRFELMNNGRVEVDINLVAGAATVAGNYAFANTLPAGERPPFQCSYPLGYNGTTAAGINTATLRVSTAGAVTLQLPALPNGTVVSCTQQVPTS